MGTGRELFIMSNQMGWSGFPMIKKSHCNTVSLHVLTMKLSLVAFEYREENVYIR